MYRTLASLLAVGVLVASPVWAACPTTTAWCSAPDRDTSGRESSSLSPGTAILFYDHTGTTDPPLLEIDSECDAAIWLDPDEDGTNTGAEIQLYRCNDRGTFSTTICPSKILADTDGDGLLNDVTLDGNTVGRIGLSDLSTRWVGIDITANPAGDDFRITAECR